MKLILNTEPDHFADAVLAVEKVAIHLALADEGHWIKLTINGHKFQINKNKASIAVFDIP